MTAWQDVERAAPEFAQRVRSLSDAHKHKTIATVRADGDGFHADITDVVHTRLNPEATMLVVEWWTPARGLRRIERG